MATDAGVELLWLSRPINFCGEPSSRCWNDSDQCSPTKGLDGNRSGEESEKLQSAEGTKSLNQFVNERAKKASEETSANNTMTSN